MKIGCVIYFDNIRYKKLSECACNSFKTFHQNIPVYIIEDIDNSNEEVRKIPSGIKKFIAAYQAAKAYKLDKIIILGADTITCDVLHEFLYDNIHDVITTLDYPYSLKIGNTIELASNENHVNADVVCFNNIQALERVLEICDFLKTDYHEQAALNCLCNVEKKYKCCIADGNYHMSNIVYNARAKGNCCAIPNTKPWFKYAQNFHVKNKRLFTGVHENIFKEKLIKVWHYCDGFGTLDEQKFEILINEWINQGFNQETKDFFTNVCNCGNFFKEKFTI